MDLTLINERRNNSIYTDGKKTYKIFNKGYKKNDLFLEAFITSIAYKNEQLKIEMADGVRIKMELIENLIVKYMNNIRIVSGEKSGFVVDMPKKNLNGFIERLEEIVADIDGLIDRD